MPSGAVFPGSFDPFTLGHRELVRRAAALFDTVTVLVAVNSGKNPLLDLASRVNLVRKAVADIPGVTVESWNGLTVDFLKSRGLSVLVRGIRGAQDLDWERQVAWTNAALHPGCETVLLPSSPETSHIASSLVRDILRHGGDPSFLLPDSISGDILALRAVAT